MTITITQQKITDKITRNGGIIGTKTIKYPHFECDGGKNGKKLCDKMNCFYKDIAVKFSDFADRKLPKRAGETGGKLKIAMNYLISKNDEDLINVVIDLIFYDGRGARKKRVSQLWSVKTSEMMQVGKILKTDFSSRRKLFSLVLSEAEKNLRSPGFVYFDDMLKRLRRHFSVFNCFMVPEGLCFFVDAGKISPTGFGVQCFVIQNNELKGLLRGDKAV